MRRWIQRLRRTRHIRPVPCRLNIESLEDRSLPSSGFVQSALVSDIPGLAPNTDLVLPEVVLAHLPSCVEAGPVR